MKNLFGKKNLFRTLTIFLVMAGLAYITVDVFKSEIIDKKTDFEFHDVVWDHYELYDDYEDNISTVTIFTESGETFEISTSFKNCVSMPDIFKFSKGQKLRIGTIKESGFLSWFRDKNAVYRLQFQDEDLMDPQCVADSSSNVRWIVGLGAAIIFLLLFKVLRGIMKKGE